MASGNDAPANLSGDKASHPAAPVVNKATSPSAPLVTRVPFRIGRSGDYGCALYDDSPNRVAVTVPSTVSRTATGGKEFNG